MKSAFFPPEIWVTGLVHIINKFSEASMVWNHFFDRNIHFNQCKENIHLNRCLGTKETGKFVSSLPKNKTWVWGQKLLIVAKWRRKHGLVQLKYLPVILKNYANTSVKRHNQKPLVQSKRGGHWSTKTMG